MYDLPIDQQRRRRRGNIAGSADPGVGLHRIIAEAQMQIDHAVDAEMTQRPTTVAVQRHQVITGCHHIDNPPAVNRSIRDTATVTFTRGRPPAGIVERG